MPLAAAALPATVGTAAVAAVAMVAVIPVAARARWGRGILPTPGGSWLSHFLDPGEEVVVRCFIGRRLSRIRCRIRRRAGLASLRRAAQFRIRHRGGASRGVGAGSKR